MNQEDYDKYKEACKIVNNFELELFEKMLPRNSEPFLGEDGKWYKLLDTRDTSSIPKEDSQNR
jgi:hypothetical protein